MTGGVTVKVRLEIKEDESSDWGRGEMTRPAQGSLLMSPIGSPGH